ncbi:sulfurtransferase complex subunit TusD [Shewanella waksmanii]|uniref:sulfurtransferase complex subunit TusD n=1 Tax=Shewanella waksmanii TaxID=213783 RepID=UPI00048B32BF|nr:sulfurtransferase complex subunit TusD [Shewanella waksmanii]
MSKLIIQVNQPAYGKQTSYTAYKYTEAALKQGHEVICVFFYLDGVHNSSALHLPASDEFDLAGAWQELSERHNVKLVNCASAALRRGIISQAEAQDNQLPHWNLHSRFTMGGLGELVTGIEHADRLISF